MGPNVSTAIDTNSWEAGRVAYLLRFRSAACSAAPPGTDDDYYYYYYYYYYYISYGASSSPLLLRGAPDYGIDTVSELTLRSATGNCEGRTCPRSLPG